MKWLRASTAILAGFALVVAGFIYDMGFAGLPFQDPTPEMQANWLHHKEIASNVILGGIGIFLVGMVWGW